MAISICAIYVGLVVKFAVSTELNWIIDAIGGAAPAIFAAIYFWRKYQVSPANIVKTVERKITHKIYSEYGFIPEEYERLKFERTDAIEEIRVLQEGLTHISADLKRESAKIDPYSVDISLAEK